MNDMFVITGILIAISFGIVFMMMLIEISTKDRKTFDDDEDDDISSMDTQINMASARQFDRRKKIC